MFFDWWVPKLFDRRRKWPCIYAKITRCLLKSPKFYAFEVPSLRINGFGWTHRTNANGIFVKNKRRNQALNFPSPHTYHSTGHICFTNKICLRNKKWGGIPKFLLSLCHKKIGLTFYSRIIAPRVQLCLKWCKTICFKELNEVLHISVPIEVLEMR